VSPKFEEMGYLGSFGMTIALNKFFDYTLLIGKFLLPFFEMELL
jgi:hypothetical protein